MMISKAKKSKPELCIFCGSSRGKRPEIAEAARQTAMILAKNRWDLVFGGSNTGIMKILAEKALECHIAVYGISSKEVEALAEGVEGLTHYEVCNTIESRKRKMIERSDAFLILPGGVGTMDEFFTVLAMRSLSKIKKPIAIFNIEGYWYSLRALLDRMTREGFMVKSDDVDFLQNSEDLDRWLSSKRRAQAAKGTKYANHNE